MKKVISILLMILFVMVTANVQAASDSFHTTLTINNSQAKRGDTITVTIGLKDIAIESGEKGIGAYTAEIQFDSSVLEYVSVNGTDKWEAPLYQDGFITSNTKDAKVVNRAQSIATITFKVKENAKLGETSIALRNFSGSAATLDILASSNGATKLTIIDNSSNSSNSSNSTNTTNTKKDNLKDNKAQENSNTKSDLSILPKTGEEQNPIVMILYTLIGLSIIGVIGLVIEKTKN